jgi:hypothetical protein
MVLLLLPPVIEADQVESKLFDGYLGEWQGTFRVYSPEGKLIKSMQAYHIYKRVDQFTIEGLQRIVYSDGKVENIKARDSLKNGKLTCEVESDLYGRKVLEGHVEGNQVFWWRKDKDAFESFRERVINDGKIYAIDGYGIYGPDRSTIYTYAGEYKRVD